ncbi:MAG TPA: CotH kinase family protein, partial [Verrucomicrobiae bacterium]|nr:CotH kinase family protein [Verrucomicrobiae bacterium]
RAAGSADRHLRLVNGQMANQVNSVAFPSISDAESDAGAIDLDYRFSGTGEGTERLSVMLIPNSVHGSEGVGVRFDALQNLREPNLPGVFAIQLLHNPENGQNALTLHWDGMRRSTLDVPSGAFRQRAFHHVRVDLKKIQTGVNATITLTADPASDPRAPHANSTLTATIPGMKLGNQRLQLAGRIGHWDQTIDVDEVQFQIAGAAGLVAEEFDLSGQISSLKQGQNILAIHALNRSSADTNFFILPELLAGHGAVRTTQPLYLPDPTPGGGNRLGYADISPPPVFSTRGGVFKDPVKVELAAKGGVVRYTMDGSEPTASSPEYSQPIVLNRSTLLKARTFLPNNAPSATGIETYTLLDPDLANFTSNLPVIIINSFGRYISANNKSPVSIRFVNPRSGRTTLLGPADFEGRATANLRGFSTLRQPKNSMTVRLRDENGDKIKAGLFGLPKESDWVLYAPYSDKTLLRDALAYELSNAMGRYAPRTRFVEVYVDRNGGRLSSQSDYVGVYVLVERIGTGPNRLAIDPAGPEDTKEPDISGGYVFKRDHFDRSERLEPSFRTSHGNRFFYVEPKGTEITREQSAWITSYVSQFERALYGSSFQDPTQGYARYLDVDAFIDQHWLIEATKNIDGFRYSAFVHKPRNGKLTMGPAWDWNLSFGNADYHEGDNPRGWYYDLLRESEICWYRRLSEDPEFMQRTIDRWAELRRTVFSRTRILRRIDEMAAELNEAQSRNFRRWPILGRSVNPNSFVGRTYQEEIDWMKDWAARRIDWIDSQFLRAPTIKSGTGGLTVSASGGQIYYTLDGSDPRARGGQPSAKAVAYKGPVTAKAGETIRTRVRRGDQWSGISSNQDKQE